MREILFRAKAKNNGKWVYGTYCPYDWNICGERKENPQIIIISDDKMIDGLWCEVIPETVGQYTGFTDKNGKKIFEGDIIQSLETKETAVVQWFPEHSAFMVWCKSSNEVGFLYECRKSNIEVIGTFTTTLNC